jgi:restriction endonuclease S subunit
MPQEWPAERLGALGKWLSGGTPRMANEEYWGGSIPWVSPKDMKVARLVDALDHVTAVALGNGTRLAPKHALLLVVRGMILAHSFPVARAERPLAFNQDIKALVLRTNVDSDFLLWWLQAHESRLLAVTTDSTHGTKRMPMDGLQSVLVQLPPFSEQCAIAEALSNADALIESLEQLLAKKRYLKQGAMQELLTGKRRLPGFRCARGFKQTDAGMLPDDWQISTVGAEFSIQLGKMLDSEKNVGVLKPFLGNRAVQWGRVELGDLGEVKLTPFDLQRFRLRKGDLLVCEGGEIGRAAVWRDPISECYYQKALHRLRPIGDYNVGLMLSVLERLASTGVLLNFATQTSIAHLPKDKFETVPIPYPPPAEQTAIAAILADMDAELAATETKLAKARHIKQGMMQELLTGRIRLV